MSESTYIPLRVHSEYSLVDGTIRLKDLANKCKETGIPAVALTDKNNIFGAFKHSSACHDQGVQAIVGSDLFLVDDAIAYSGVLPVIAQTQEGYLKLSRIMTDSQLRRGDDDPTVNFADFGGDSSGLITLSGGLDGPVGRAIVAGNYKSALESARLMSSVFPGRFYIEVSRTGRDAEEEVNVQSMQLAKELNLPVVATHPSVFLEPGDYEAHATRVAISRGEVLSDPAKMGYTPEQYLLTPQEMREKFKDIPGAISNTVEIAKRCAFAIERREPCLPDFPDAKETGLAEGDLLHQRAIAGLDLMVDKLVSENDKSNKKDYYDRLEREIGVIKEMGFPGYFLIVSDFISWAKSNGIPVGPGRGSGAGSLVAYAIGVTDIDPLKYDLLFERFLNPERVSMPDFDIDFCMDNRDRVIDYVSEKYGQSRVSRIITYGRMAARAAIRDVGRSMGYNYGFVDRLAKMIPFAPDITLESAIESSEELREALQDSETKTLFARALEIEGLARNAGKHAGGIIIAPSDISDFTPSFYDANSGQITTQFDMKDIESVGLVKFDFLGLRTLTIIDAATKEIRKKHDPEFDLRAIPLDDAKTFSLLNAAETTAVFQLESPGMKKLISNLQPDSFEDVIALVALFRPGPLQSGMVDDFVERKHGRVSIEYPHPDLEEILKPTYGVILYQEQVMQISQKLAGYTLGEADILRRAMGKKKPEEMAKQRSIFVKGAVDRGVDEQTATYIFDLMEKFAGYGFNKSHSAAYALIAYQTAYLKAHYPAEFMAATLSSDMDKTDKVSIFVRECRRMGIDLAPPSVNTGGSVFLPTDGSTSAHPSVAYGLSAIKGLGENVARAIVSERGRSGDYSSIEDLALRLSSKTNKRVLEKLVASGACDDFDLSRAALTERIPAALKSGQQALKDKLAGQSDMFSSTPTNVSAQAEKSVNQAWSLEDKLNNEYKALGLYLSSHPVSLYGQVLSGRTSGSIGEVIAEMEKNPPDKEFGSPRVLCGLVVARRDIKGHSFLTIEDETGEIDVAVFSELKATVSRKLDENTVLVFMGTASPDDYTGGFRIVADRVLTLDEIKALPADMARAKVSPAKNQGSHYAAPEPERSVPAGMGII